MDPWRWQITQADQDRAHMWKVDGGNGILLLGISLPFIWITWGHGYINIYIFSLFLFLDLHVSKKKFQHWDLHVPLVFFWVMVLGHAIFSLFLYSPCLIWGILGREIFKHGVYFAGGWYGIANFQCRSLAGGAHMILIKQVWKDISLGSQSLKKLNATTRHICVKFVSRRSAYGFGRTNTWSCNAMEVFFLIKISQIYKQRKQGSFHQTISH